MVRSARAREFVRTFNALLKSVRLYRFEHSRSMVQFETCWKNLEALLPGENGAGLLLAVSGAQLLVDGAAIESSPVERSFTDLLSSAGLASVHFTADTTKEEFARLVRAFAGAGGKGSNLPEQLKEAFGDSAESAIRINKVRFVVEGEEQPRGDGGAGVAAAVMMSSLGPEAEKLKDWLHDPQKLLQLIAAAESAQGQPAAGATPASAPPAALATEDDVLRVVHLLSQLAAADSSTGPGVPASQVRQQFHELPGAMQASLQHTLATLAASRLPTAAPQPHLLVQAAEQLAIRHALARFERGETRVDAVHALLQRLGGEIEKLRKILGAYEDRMARAGLAPESHTEVLDRQFWAQVPESGKQAVLLSPEAWCIPPRNVASYVEQLLTKGDSETAGAVLKNYAACARAPEAEARRKAAGGIAELAKLHVTVGEEALAFAIHQVGRQLNLETDSEIRNQLRDAFVRLSHEGAAQRRYASMQQVLSDLRDIEDVQPEIARDLRLRISMEVRVQDFIEEGIRMERLPADLVGLLRSVPQLAADQIAARFGRATRREECERLVAMAGEAGGESLCYLRELLEGGTDASAVSTVGLLSRLEPTALNPAIAARLAKWNLSQQDQLVRQVSLGNAPERGALLLLWFRLLHPLLLPEAIDEMGMTEDRSVANFLLELAAGERKEFDAPYLRLKAIEALGRLRESRAAAPLRSLVEAKKMWGWEHPYELRLVAAQALAKIDPQWARTGLAATGLTLAEMNLVPPLDPSESGGWSRPRRYPRLMLALTLPAVASTENRRSNFAIRVLNLGGGLASTDIPIGGGTPAALEVRSGLRTIRAEVLVREARREQVTFEVVRVNFEERAKLRKLLAGLQAVAV